MGTMREYASVACPFDRVPERLAECFAGGNAVIPLRVHFGDLRVECDVDFHIQTKPGYPGYRLFDVSWKPKDGGPFPTFSGTLSVAEDAVGWSRLEIDGTYRPPFGIAGAAFDAVVGGRIAQAAAVELLAEIKRLLLVPV